MFRLVYIVILFVIIWLWKYISYSPNSQIFSKNYGSSSDSVDTILSRCVLANNYKDNLNYKGRHLIFALIITFFVLLAYENAIPRPYKYIQSVFIMWVLLQGLHEYVQHHCEKFSHYAIDRNISLIRRKLKLGKKIVGEQSLQNLLPCWNYNYSSDKK